MRRRIALQTGLLHDTHLNEPIPILMMPRIRLGFRLRGDYRRHAGCFVSAISSMARRVLVRSNTIRRGFLVRVETLITLTMRAAVAFRRQVRESQERMFPHEVVDRFQCRNAGAEDQKEDFGAGPGGEIVGRPCDTYLASGRA